jgi:succinate dehydrogenase/fumarate reductase flavoprotein subunit
MAEGRRRTGAEGVANAEARERAAEPRLLSKIARFDDEADVVVVGQGCAGACAALEASATGAEVLAIECKSAGGGTSALSGGILYLGGGTPVQKACGFEDDAENMFKYLLPASGPNADEAKVRRYCDDSLLHYFWLEEQGVPFKHSFYPEPSMEAPTDDCLVFTGGEDVFPWNTLARPVARGHKPRAEAAAGGFLMRCLLAAVAKTRTRALHDLRAETLVVDADGRVAGVIARRDGREVALRARRGVVLAAGGFVLDDDLVVKHCPQVLRCSWRLSDGADDGRGIRMGLGAGGEAIHMEALECAIPLTPPRRLVRGILVNGSGLRFINEDAYYGRIGQTSLFRQDGRMFFIHDDDTYEVNQAGFEADYAGDTIEELEREIGLPEGSLVSTVALYNKHAARGEDPLFHKGRDFVKPLIEAPFGAIDCSTGKVTYATFTLGGLHTLPGGEVLTPANRVVPGLYAAGRTTSGICAFGYVSGISLGDASYFGRLAGRSAATAPR